MFCFFQLNSTLVCECDWHGIRNSSRIQESASKKKKKKTPPSHNTVMISLSLVVQSQLPSLEGKLEKSKLKESKGIRT